LTDELRSHLRVLTEAANGHWRVRFA